MTRLVQRAIASAVVLVLTGLPLTGLLCTIVCSRTGAAASADRPPADHEPTSDASCHESTGPGDVPSVGLVPHDCNGQHATLDDPAEVNALARAACAVPLVDIDQAASPVRAIVADGCDPGCGPPDVPSGPTRLPLVLRI